MRQRYVVQVEDTVPTPTPLVSAGTTPVMARRGERVEIEETPPVVQKPALSMAAAPVAPDLVTQRQTEINNLLRQSRVESAREPAPIQRPARTVETTVIPTTFPAPMPVNHAGSGIEKKYQAQQPHAWHQQPRSSSGNGRPRLPRINWLPNRWPKRAWIGFVVILLLVLSTVGSFLLAQSEIRGVQTQMQSLAEDLQAGRFASADDRLKVLDYKRQQYLSLLAIIHPEVRLLLGKDKSIFLDKLGSVSDSGLQVLRSGLGIYSKLDEGYQQFAGTKDGDSIQTLRAATGRLEGLYSGLANVYTELQKLNNPFAWPEIDKVKNKTQDILPQMRRTLLAAQQVGYILPDLLGADGRRQYIVLFQNNQELRPTGGFIGSFAILTVEKGKLIDFKVQDVYEADGQLRGFVTPPVEIPQYLGEAQWYLRDVNWSADFPTVALQTQWFVEKELGIRADGVIAMDLPMVQTLLAATGPLEIPDYSEVVTKDNLYERAQQRSELNFFPGSKQKRDFLSAVAQQLFVRLFQNNTNKIALANAVLQSLDQSDLLVSLNTASSAAVIHDLGWDGAVRTPPCPNPFVGLPCTVDTVMQVEANVGVNKVNRYVERKIHHQVVLQGGQATHTRTIQLVNNAKQNAWPGGPYRTYIRLYVPTNSQLTGIQVDGADLLPSAIRTSNEAGKQVWGWYVEVPTQNQKTITVHYVTSNAYAPTKAASVYALFEQKQPGTGGDNVKHEFLVKDKNISTIAPQPAISENNRVVFVSSHQTHQFMAIEVK